MRIRDLILVYLVIGACFVLVAVNWVLMQIDTGNPGSRSKERR